MNREKIYTGFYDNNLYEIIMSSQNDPIFKNTSLKIIFTQGEDGKQLRQYILGI